MADCLRKLALDSFRRGCDAVSPERRVEEVLSLSDTSLSVIVGGLAHHVSIGPTTKVSLIAFGKAAVAMARGAEAVLGGRLDRGIVIAPQPEIGSCLRSTVICGAAGNLPDADSVGATNQALKLISETDKEDTVFLFLISGGGSALFCSPDDVTLSDKLATIQVLVSHGATIQQLNTVRQKLSKFKGGKTLRSIHKGKIVSLIMSDIIGDPIHLIASGPTVISDSAQDQFSVLQSLNVDSSLLPPAVVEQLLKPELPTNDNSRFNDAVNCVIVNNRLALDSLRDHLSSAGYSTHIVTSSLEGNATERGEQFARLLLGGPGEMKDRLREICEEFSLPDPLPSQLALVFGGETTVQIRGPGRGGRSQEMVLSCLASLMKSVGTTHDALPGRFLFMSAGTDGQDGPTDVAGAYITDEDITPSALESAKHSLATSDSYSFWQSFKEGKCHLKTGATGTNVMDIQLLLIHT